MSNPHSFPEKNVLKKVVGAVKSFGCKYNWYTSPRPSQDTWTSEALSELRTEGIVILENYFTGEKLQRMQAQNEQAMNQGSFNWPVVSEAKIPADFFNKAKSEGDLINFNHLAKQKVLVDRSGHFDYEEFVTKTRPHLLKVTLDKYGRDFLDLWLDEKILNVVASYLECIPKMTEAYVRRSFPSHYPFQNNNWHRDTNHKTKLVKVFFLISDMNPANGPFQYIRRTCRDFSVCNDAEYYADPSGHFSDYEQRITPKSIPAGSVIIADTRGLHRASLPETGHRDLGYAVFFPLFFASKVRHFTIKTDEFEQLSEFQKKFVLSSTVSEHDRHDFEFSL